jgi:hypothetical protein
MESKYLLISPLQIYRVAHEVNVEKKFNESEISLFDDNKNVIKKQIDPKNAFFKGLYFLEDYLNHHLNNIKDSDLPFRMILEKTKDGYVEYITRRLVPSSDERTMATPVYFNEFYARGLDDEQLAIELKRYKKLSNEVLVQIKKDINAFYERGELAVDYHIKDMGLQKRLRK